MATEINLCVMKLAFVFVFVSVSAFVPAGASPERTKTVEFNVKPGGVVHTFTEGIVSDCIEYPLYFTLLAYVFKRHPIRCCDHAQSICVPSSARLNVVQFTVYVIVLAPLLLIRLLKV